MKYIGMDVHKQSTSVCMLNQNGKTIKEFKVRGPVSEAVDRLRRYQGPMAVCYEASCGYGHLHDLLRKVAQRIVVAHPGQLRLIFRSKRKNDRVDAKKLATLLLLDQVPQVHVPSIDVRAWRHLIEFRHRLVAKRTRVKNALRALCRSHGIALPSGHRLWSRAGLAILGQLEFPSELANLERDMQLDELETFERQIKRAEKKLNELADKHPGVQLLQTIPGVGPRTAEAAVAYIDDPKRFKNSKQVGCYFGLVPSQDRSADVNRLGHITREGPATVRKLLTEAAWQGIRRSPSIRKFYERICQEDPDRRKLALIATAHLLARVMLAMLRTGEVWREVE